MTMTTPDSHASTRQAPPNPDTPSAAANNGPLTGFRIIDLTAVVLGPMCTRELADFGADVVKIEPPAGDLMRANGVSLHPGMSSIYLALNRNKRSVMLDLKNQEDRQALSKLIEGADAFVHNMRVPAIEKLGFGYEAVRQINPRIVYCAATAFGQQGPHRNRPAFDDIIQASCGLAGVNALVGHDAPAYIPSLIADKTAGLAVANALLAALVCRERNGIGQYVEVPMLETMVAFTLTEHMGGMTFPGSTAPAGYARLLHGGRQPWRTSDGWIALLPYTERHWRAFFTLAGRENLLDQYDMSDRHARNANIQKIYQELRHITQTKTTAEWLTICDQIDVPCSPIYALDELPAHPHLQAVQLFEESEHPTEGPIRQIRPTALFSRTPTQVRSFAPTLGQHTAEVLAEAGIARDDAPTGRNQ